MCVAICTHVFVVEGVGADPPPWGTSQCEITRGALLLRTARLGGQEISTPYSVRITRMALVGCRYGTFRGRYPRMARAPIDDIMLADECEWTCWLREQTVISLASLRMRSNRWLSWAFTRASSLKIAGGWWEHCRAREDLL